MIKEMSIKEEWTNKNYSNDNYSYICSLRRFEYLPPLIGASMYVTLPFEISCMCLDNAKVSKGFPLVWSRIMALGLVSNGANSLQIVLEMAEVGKHKDTFKNQK